VLLSSPRCQRPVRNVIGKPIDPKQSEPSLSALPGDRAAGVAYAASVIRAARPDDVPVMLALVRELASYEREPDAVVATESDLENALFSDGPALFGLVAEDGGVVVGFALWFLNFSTWVGRHGIYLEDLYVRPETRGAGHGRQLLGELARIADARGYGRVEWAVLDWNEPAHRFYESLGAEPLNEWTTWRLDRDALHELAGAAQQNRDADGRV
jgi:GNAT superfamily N-acetyltransferase